MKRLPRTLWHRVHLLSIPMFVVSTIHGFTAGADNRNLAAQWAAVTGGVLVVLVVALRLVSPGRRTRVVTPPRPAPVRPEQPSEAAFRGRSADRTSEPSRI
jgi:hypothetical protein